MIGGMNEGTRNATPPALLDLLKGRNFATQVVKRV